MNPYLTSCRLFILLAAGVAAADTGDLKHPDWHPDGDFLVAEGSCAGSIDLFLIDVQKRSVKLVFDGQQTEGYPRWFSDGKRITFHQIDGKRNSRLYLAELSLDGRASSVQRISEGPFDIEPAPSPDGTLLAYSRQGEKGLDIALLDLGAGNRSRVWKTEFAENFPSWHPGGAAITFYARKETGTQIYSLDIASDQIVVLTSGEGPNFVGDLSPDGSLLAYSSERTGDREIYLRHLEGKEERRVTDRAGRDGYAKFSPTGDFLAYHAEIDAGYTELRVLHLESGGWSAYSCESWHP